MKKNFALLLAVIMLLGCVLAVAPAADSTGGAEGLSEDYKPDIAYTNVNYVDDLVLMFAVPVPAALDEGSSVKLMIWDTKSDSFSYKNTVSTSAGKASAVAVEHEDDTVTIGGVQHYVFKYNGLTPDMMTDVVYARAAVIDKGGNATAYGKVIDYSVVEYVETAKGGFSTYGAPTVSEDVIELLDSLLNFGALVQNMGNQPYMPNGYLANDELHKIWITPVVAGKPMDKVFGGFFKYAEGSYATVCAPFFDGFEIDGYKDADGNKLEDANTVGYDDAEGFQIVSVDADVEITIEYSSKSFINFYADYFGENFVLDNVTQITSEDTLKSLGLKYGNAVFTNISVKDIIKKLHLGGKSTDSLTGDKENIYHGFRTIADPSNPDNLVFLVTMIDRPELHFQYMRPSDYPYFGYGDTLDEALTIEFELGKYTDAPVNTRAYKIVYSAGDSNTIEGYTTSNHDLNLFRVTNDKVYLVNGKTGNAINEGLICTLTKDRLTKIAITIYDDGTVKAFCSDESGEMKLACELDLVMPDAFTEMQTQHLANLADDNLDNNDDLVSFASVGNWLSMHTLYSNWQLGVNINATKKEAILNDSVMINGVDTPLKNADGSFNMEAVQAYAEENYGFLLGYFKFCMGDIYGFESDANENEKLIKSMTGEDFGEGFAFSNLTDKIGVYDGYPAVIAAIGATHGAESDTALNGYRFEKLFRRVWFDGNIGGTKFFQGIKTVADPSNPQNLVLQITSANRNTLDLETIKPEELAKADWGNGGAITVELELGKPTPNADVTTLPFQLHRRTDENPDAGLSGNKTITVFTIKNNKVYLCKFGANAADETKLICEIPDTGFVKFAIEINDNGLIKAYSQDESGAMVCVCELNVSTHTALGTEDFASWMNYVITPRWGVGENTDADTIQAATVEIDGAQVPVYADGAYNEAALQLYMEQNHSFLLDNYKIVAGAIYE